MGCAAFLGAPVLACTVGHRRQARQHLMMSPSEQESSKIKSMLSSLEEIALKVASLSISRPCHERVLSALPERSVVFTRIFIAFSLAISLQGTEPRGRRAAAWAAAMLCAHARRELRIGVDVTQGQKPSDSSARIETPESTHLPLHALPQDGAMFALVSYLNKGKTKLPHFSLQLARTCAESLSFTFHRHVLLVSPLSRPTASCCLPVDCWNPAIGSRPANQSLRVGYHFGFMCLQGSRRPHLKE